MNDMVISRQNQINTGFQDTPWEITLVHRPDSHQLQQLQRTYQLAEHLIANGKPGGDNLYRDLIVRCCYHDDKNTRSKAQEYLKNLLHSDNDGTRLALAQVIASSDLRLKLKPNQPVELDALFQAIQETDPRRPSGPRAKTVELLCALLGEDMQELYADRQPAPFIRLNAPVERQPDLGKQNEGGHEWVAPHKSTSELNDDPSPPDEDKESGLKKSTSELYEFGSGVDEDNGVAPEKLTQQLELQDEGIDESLHDERIDAPIPFVDLDMEEADLPEPVKILFDQGQKEGPIKSVDKVLKDNKAKRNEIKRLHSKYNDKSNPLTDDHLRELALESRKDRQDPRATIGTYVGPLQFDYGESFQLNFKEKLVKLLDTSNSDPGTPIVIDLVSSVTGKYYTILLKNNSLSIIDPFSENNTESNLTCKNLLSTDIKLLYNNIHFAIGKSPSVKIDSTHVLTLQLHKEKLVERGAYSLKIPHFNNTPIQIDRVPVLDKNPVGLLRVNPENRQFGPALWSYVQKQRTEQDGKLFSKVNTSDLVEAFHELTHAEDLEDTLRLFLEPADKIRKSYDTKGRWGRLMSRLDLVRAHMAPVTDVIGQGLRFAVKAPKRVLYDLPRAGITRSWNWLKSKLP